MLFTSLTSSSDLFLGSADGLEFRLDQIPLPNLKECSVPYILTPKSYDLSWICQLLTQTPPYMDLDSKLDPTFLKKVIQDNPKTKFILSYHNFESMPQELESIYTHMKQFDAFAYKIAAFTKTANDALKLLLFGKQHSDLSVICMGEIGQFGRVLGPIAGNIIDYAYTGFTPAAPGQLTVTEFASIYRYKDLNPQTEIYGLIGTPVSQSIGHLYHNEVFKKQKKNAVYVKINVQENELDAFFKMSQYLGFKGFSVTMPLKEKVIPFLDEIDPDAKIIGAVNTILMRDKRFIGTNTDGIGALDALEKRGSVKGKTMVIMGAGGAAKAIAFEAAKRGANIWIYNRTLDTAKRLPYPVGIPKNYEIVVKCTPEALPISFDLKPQVLDIVYIPKITPFLKKAEAFGCEIISGEEMFFNQAAKQSSFWLQ